MDFFTFGSYERLTVYKTLKDKSSSKSVGSRRLVFVDEQPLAPLDLEKRIVFKLGRTGLV
jgi:hypothetical protein